MPSDRINNWYSATANNSRQWPQLQGEQVADIAIVGGGITGVATALMLTERGYSVILLEANRIGFGATGRNGGQVTGSLSGDQAMLKQWRLAGHAEAESWIWDMRWRGQSIIENWVEKYKIECDLKRGHLFAAWQPSHLAELESLYDEAQSRGFQDEIRLLDANDIQRYIGTDLYAGGLYNSRNLHLHSLNLCLGEAQAAESLGVHIYEQTEVQSIESNATEVLATEHGQVSASTVILAGNAYHRLYRKQLGNRLFPASLANLVTEPLSPEQCRQFFPVDAAVYDTRFVLDYYRLTGDNRLMFGGGASYSGSGSANVAALLQPAMEKTFPQLRGLAIDYQWRGLAGITINRIPQIGRVSNNVYFAQGYSGHGMATSHIFAEVLAEAVGGSLESFDRLAALKSVSVPGGRVFGQALLTIGMYWFLLRERFR